MKVDELMYETVKAIVDRPDEVRIDPEKGAGSVMLHVTVAASDLGKVIGKQGRTARSLRTLLGAMAKTEGWRYELNIVGDQREREVTE